MHIGAYESTVIYFGLTNSPVTFQTMMNDLFQDLINQGDTATFIDDILVATDTKEEHNNTEILGPSQLLQKVHKGLCQGSGTITRIGQKGAEVEVGKGVRGSIWETKRSVHNGTCFSNTRHRWRNESGGKCLRLRDRRSVVDEM